MQQMVHDGGGGSIRPPVRSEVHVDPGDIRDFARFLDEMTERVRDVEKTFEPYVREIDPVRADFGAYYASAGATADHDKAVRAAHANLVALRKRVAELSEGTLLLSRGYAAAEDLNASVASDIKAALGNKAL
ncbi:hypothetical protein GCM10027418_31100 [Mariniluteicoccus endophyticus]